MYVNKADFTQEKLILTSRSPMYVNKADFTEEKLILTIFP